MARSQALQELRTDEGPVLCRALPGQSRAMVADSERPTTVCWRQMNESIWRFRRLVGTLYLIVFGLPALGYLLVTGVQEGTLWRWEGIVILIPLTRGMRERSRGACCERTHGAGLGLGWSSQRAPIAPSDHDHGACGDETRKEAGERFGRHYGSLAAYARYQNHQHLESLREPFMLTAHLHVLHRRWSPSRACLRHTTPFLSRTLCHPWCH
jgi:hypothetical protein